MYLEKINQPSDIRSLRYEELGQLAAEMRKALLHKLSKNGGHFARILVWWRQRSPYIMYSIHR